MGLLSATRLFVMFTFGRHNFQLVDEIVWLLGGLLATRMDVEESAL